MEILNALNNPIVQMLGGLLAGGLGMWLYSHFKITSLVKNGGADFGKALGELIYKHAVKGIKDEKLKAKLIEDLDIASDEFNNAFDEAIRGK